MNFKEGLRQLDRHSTQAAACQAGGRRPRTGAQGVGRLAALGGRRAVQAGQVPWGVPPVVPPAGRAQAAAVPVVQAARAHHHLPLLQAARVLAGAVPLLHVM